VKVSFEPVVVKTNSGQLLAPRAQQCCMARAEDLLWFIRHLLTAQGCSGSTAVAVAVAAGQPGESSGTRRGRPDVPQQQRGHCP